MTINYLIYSLGSIPMFSSRMFLPAFLISVVMVFPEWMPFIDNTGMELESGAVFGMGEWIVALLGVLSILEIVADKNSSLQSMMGQFEGAAKPLVFFLMQLAIMDEGSMQILDAINWGDSEPEAVGMLMSETTTTAIAAVSYPQIGFALLCAFGVFILTVFRRRLLGFLEQIDEDDVFRIRRLISYTEDSYVLFGFFILMFFGMLAVILFAIVILAVFLLKRNIERRAEKKKVPCVSCGATRHVFSPNCGSCGAGNEQLMKIGILGQPGKNPVEDYDAHRMNLLSHRRCSSCAEKLPSRKTNQSCKACGTPAFTEESLSEYRSFVTKRFLYVLVFSALVGWIPIAGIILSIVAYNLYVGTPFSRYVSRGESFAVKILTRILTAIVVFFGSFFGLIVAPIYVGIRYLIGRAQYAGKRA